MIDDIISYASVFEPSISITIVFKGNSNYKDLEPIFEKYGYGFYSPSTKSIFLDGEVFTDNDELDINDLRFVEAHEVSHLLFGHDGLHSDEDELDADLGAYVLLKRKGLSTDRLENEFGFRHGIEFDKKLLVRLKNFM